MGKERTADWYDEKVLKNKRMFKTLEKSPWKPLYYTCADLIFEKENRILDLGCGSGRFAKLLKIKGFKNYLGIDFSKVLIDEAKRYIPDYSFLLNDIFDEDIQKLFSDFDIFVMLELLEHIERDLELLKSIPKNKIIILSVPNFDSAAHVRWFNSMEDVIHRYKELIDIKIMKTVVYSNKKEAYVIRGIRK